MPLRACRRSPCCTGTAGVNHSPRVARANAMGPGASRPGLAVHASSASRPHALNLAAGKAALAQAGWARGASLSQAERGIAPGSARMQRWGPSAQRGPAVVEGGRDAAGASHSPSKSSAKASTAWPAPVNVEYLSMCDTFKRRDLLDRSQSWCPKAWKHQALSKARSANI